VDRQDLKGLSDVIDQLSRDVRSICPINITNGFESPHYFRGNIYGGRGGQTLSIKSGRKIHILSLLTFDLIFHFSF
jgi:hypothetical protein